MLLRRLGFVLVVSALMSLAGRAYGAGKETIEMQAQLRALQNQVAKLQEEMRTDLAALKSNVSETRNDMKQMADWTQAVNTAMKQQTADADTCADQVSGSSIALRKELSDVRTRLDQIARQLQLNGQSSTPAATPPNPPSSANPPR
jgi:chromosome segregation ATPase